MRRGRAPLGDVARQHLEPGAGPSAQARRRSDPRPAQPTRPRTQGASAPRAHRPVHTVMKLGREQSRAAALGAGPVRVVAGAGTGKTAVIAERFGRLVASGVSPASILVMTFTERAANEMRERRSEEHTSELQSLTNLV